jgi:hypothetical protein
MMVPEEHRGGLDRASILRAAVLRPIRRNEGLPEGLTIPANACFHRGTSDALKMAKTGRPVKINP